MANRVRESVRAALSQLTAMAALEPDERLLSRFASERDESAFTELVRRYGSMVMGVARRSVGAGGDAEDVFQATFLLLALKCRSIRGSVSLAAWLHGVARRTAANARKAAVRRTARERRATEPTGVAPPQAAASLRELQAVLDEELARLPEQYRAAFLLCCVEGHSRPEAAQLLRCSEGTVSSRVARARELLQTALTRRGIELTAVLVAVAVGSAARAEIPAALADSTFRLAGLLATSSRSAKSVPPAVAAIMKGGAGTRWFKLAVWAVVASCALAAVGIARLGQPDEKPPSVPQLASSARPASEDRGAGLEGNWKLTLAAGFQYEVRLERLADRYYRLHSHTVFGGLYKHDGEQLLLQKPVAGADPEFRWTLDGTTSAELTEETQIFGSRYAGATLKRDDAKNPPRESIDLGKHLLRISMETASGEDRGGAFMVPDSPGVSPADLFAQVQSGKIRPGRVELIARTPGSRSADRLEVVSFEDKDRKITATVRHIYAPDQQHANKVFYLRAKLAPLPPGKYDVEIRFEDWVKDGEKVRRAKGDEPQFAPLKCSFTVPEPPDTK